MVGQSSRSSVRRYYFRHKVNRHEASGKQLNLGIHISCVFIFLKPSHFVGFVMRWLSYGENHSNQQADCLPTYWRSGSVTRGSGLRSGNCGFDPRPSPTKDFQNGISCSFVCAQH